MNLLEITLSIGIAMAIAAAGMVQLTMQTNTLLYFKDVDYYSREVPRAVAAVQNLARGAHTFRIGTAVPAAPAGAAATYRPPDQASEPSFRRGAGQITGSNLFLKGTWGENKDKEAVIWLADNSGRVLSEGPNSISDPTTGERTFPENRYDICVSVSTNTAARMPDGWILSKNVAGMRFDIIPDSGGAVLMSVFKRMRGEGGVGISHQMILERR